MLPCSVELNRSKWRGGRRGGRGNNSFALAGRTGVGACYPGRCPGLVSALRLQRAAVSCVLAHYHWWLGLFVKVKRLAWHCCVRGEPWYCVVIILVGDIVILAECIGPRNLRIGCPCKWTQLKIFYFADLQYISGWRFRVRGMESRLTL